MKHRSEFKHGFTSRGCLHCAIIKTLHGFLEKTAHKSRDVQFFPSKCSKLDFKNLQNLKTTWKSPEQPAELTQKISKSDKNNTLIKSYFVTIVGRYCWSQLWVNCWFFHNWCNYWTSLKLGSHLPKKLFSLLQWKPFKNGEKLFFISS